MSKGILLVGEPMGLFIAQSPGALETVDGYSCAVAGAEFNVAVGMSRLEHEVAYLTKLGDDPFGRRIVNIMGENHIDTGMIMWSRERSTGFMLKSMVEQGDPEIFYFRKNSAASTLCPADVEQLDLHAYSTLHMTGILPALTDSTRATTRLLFQRARQAGMLISFDPNLRPQLWPDQQTMIDFMNEMAGRCDIFLPGIAEARLLTGLDSPAEIAGFYSNLGAKIVIIKLGAEGAYVTGEGARYTVPGFPVEKVVDTVGAGDGFAAGVLSGLMEKLSLREAVLRGNAIGAIQVMSRGDNDGLPTRAHLDAFMNR